MEKIAILISVLLAWTAEAQNFMSSYNFNQMDVRCVGVRCPAQRPYCVIKSHQTECVAHSSTPGDRRISRLSRPPLALPQQQQHRQQQEQQRQQQQQEQMQNNDGAGPSGGLFTDPQVTITLKGQNSLDVPNNNPSAPLPPLHITRVNGQGDTFGAPGQSGSRVITGTAQSGTNGQTNVGSRFPSGLNNPFSSGIFTKSTNVNNNNNNRGGPFNLEVHNVAPDFCFLRPEKGRCRGYLSRYFYNQETGQCQSFSYGGCGGNANRFETLVDCFKVCALPHGAIGSSPTVFGNARLGGPSPTELPASIAKPTENKISGGGNTLGNDNINNNVNSIKTNTDVNDQTDAIFGSNQFFSDPNAGVAQVPINDVNGDKRIGNTDFRGTGPQRPSSTTNQQRGPSIDLPRACYLDIDVGQCQGSVTRVYFNRNTGRCEIFDFGGCGGNANNFLSFPDCNRACGQNTGRGAQRPVGPVLESSSPQGSVTSPRITNLLDDNDRFSSASSSFNTMSDNSRNTNSANNFNSGANTGVATNGNIASFPGERQDQFQSLSTQRSRQRPETCYQPANPGPCLAAFSRYYYNNTEGQCLVFLYGGCGGNQNNYASREDCARECNEGGGASGGARKGISGVFSQRDALSSYPRNNDYLQQNSSFRGEGLNGLSGNGVIGGRNRQQVQQRSQASQQNNRCMMRADRGPCSKQLLRYYYDSQAGQCQAFSFGGCQGNANNFPSLVACASACDGFGGFSLSSPGGIPNSPVTANNGLGNYAGNSVRPQVCELGPFPGPCRAFIRRIYFNSNTGRCEQFVYGGCRSNGNNFQSAAECIRTCGSESSSNPVTGNTNRRNGIGASRSSRDRIGINVDPLPFSSFRFTGDEARMF